MLRLYFLQQWFSLSNLVVEEALYDRPLPARFVGLDPGGMYYPMRAPFCAFATCLSGTA